MIRINLVPGEILAKARQRQLLLQASLVGGVLGVVLVLMSVVHWAGLYRLQNDYSYKESKLKELGAIVAKVEELEKASDAVRARLGVIESLLRGRAFYPLFMSDFARTVPSGVKVTNLTTAMQAGGALKLTISAVADASDDIAGWMRTLEKSGRFSDVELGPVTGGQKYSFTLATTYTLKL